MGSTVSETCASWFHWIQPFSNAIPNKNMHSGTWEVSIAECNFIKEELRELSLPGLWFRLPNICVCLDLATTDRPAQPQLEHNHSTPLPTSAWEQASLCLNIGILFLPNRADPNRTILAQIISFHYVLSITIPATLVDAYPAQSKWFGLAK